MVMVMIKEQSKQCTNTDVSILRFSSDGDDNAAGAGKRTDSRSMGEAASNPVSPAAGWPLH